MHARRWQHHWLDVGVPAMLLNGANDHVDDIRHDFSGPDVTLRVVTAHETAHPIGHVFDRVRVIYAVHHDIDEELLAPRARHASLAHCMVARTGATNRAVVIVALHMRRARATIATTIAVGVFADVHLGSGGGCHWLSKI